MKLSLRNVNKIHAADVELNGLTVIVGENDSGKSTIGRILFSVVKALTGTKENDERKKHDRLMKYADALYKRLISVEPIFSIGNKANEGKTLFPRNAWQFVEQVKDVFDIDSYIEMLSESIDDMSATPKMKSLMKKDLIGIKQCLSYDLNRSASLNMEFQAVLESEFLNQMSQNNPENWSVMLFDDAENIMFQYDGAKENAKTDSINDEALLDITYVESPLYMHLLEGLRFSQTYRELAYRRPSTRMMVPYHIKDFTDKINSYRYRKVESKIDTKDIVGGEFEYDDRKKTVFFRKNGMELYPLNVASGIKIFGVLQMLLNSDYINAECPLVWDEPENHLHPQWQVEFAKILVQLSKSGVPILITTHSPYFLQAIRYFSALEKIEDYVNYYSAKPVDENRVDMVNVNKDLNSVFLSLATPLNRIMNVDAARQGIEL